MTDKIMDKIGLLLDNGKLNRYQNDKECELLKAEKALAKYFQMKYVIGVNSGGSRIIFST